ncbi:MAG: helix-turn-helix transcriptional regulator, partial [Roseibium sp.]
MRLTIDIKTAAEIHQGIAAAAKARRISMNITQAELSLRSGVAIATLKRFEQGGTATLATVLAVAECLDAREEFQELFPAPETATL